MCPNNLKIVDIRHFCGYNSISGRQRRMAMALVFSILGWIVMVVVGGVSIIVVAHLICEITEGAVAMFRKPK